ncbi:MAG: hypothetical protein HYX48_04190 [Chlamydiales bacterium]|nr:hypothetical protein [Chlamydiales bacterium]
MTTALQTRPFDFAGVQAPMANIALEYLTLEDLQAVGKTCKVFRVIIGERVVAVREKIARTFTAQDADAPRAYTKVFGQDARPLSEIHSELRTNCRASLNAIRVPQSYDFPGNDIGERDQATRDKNQIVRYWNQLHLPSLADDNFMRFINFLHSFAKKLEACRFTPEEHLLFGRLNALDGRDEEREQLANRQKENLKDALEHIESFAGMESLMRSIDRDFPSTDQPVKDLWTFVMRRMEVARTTPELLKKTTLSPTHMLRLEQVVLSCQGENDLNMMQLRQSILHSPVAIAGIDAATTAVMMRTYFNDPAHLPELDQIRRLNMLARLGIPQEITRLRNLEVLRVDNRESLNQPTRLPDWFQELQNLRELSIRSSWFKKIPDAIARLPHLSYLEIIQDDAHPIPVLPDALARRMQCNALSTHFASAFEHFFETKTYDLRNLEYLGLDRRHLTQIPFFISFKENFSLPYIPAMFLLTPIMPLLDAFENVRIPILQYIALVPACILTPFIYLASAIPAFLLNIPILIYNILLDKALEPVVTYFRDQLGYSRMVNV